MHICYDHQIFSYQQYGGISRHIAELLKEFARSRTVAFTVGLCASSNHYLQDADFLPIRKISPRPRRDFLQLVRTLVTYVRNRQASIRLLQGQTFDLFCPTFYDPYFLPYLHGKPYVLTIYDMIPERFPEAVRKKGIYSLLVTDRWIRAKRTLAVQAAHIIAISRHTANDVHSIYGIAPHKISVVHLGCSFPIRSSASVSMELPAKYLLYVGERKGYKNFATFIEGIAPILRHDDDLKVICAGGGGLTSEECALFKRLDIQPHIRHTPADDATLSSLYQTALACVYPSRYEGFGLPILEAFACRCPLIVSQASCFPEIAGDAAAYFDPDNAESIGTRVVEVLNNAELREILRERGTARLQHFSWAATARATQHVYENVLSTSKKTQ